MPSYIHGWRDQVEIDSASVASAKASCRLVNLIHVTIISCMGNRQGIVPAPKLLLIQW